eukprot:1159822-Pelagomonas_calceolata.AAC.2
MLISHVCAHAHRCMVYPIRPATHSRARTLPAQGMARLLEMLSEWFSNTLGKRLLEHLCMWISPEGPCGQGGNCAWRPGEEAAVAAHLMELFHLLPRQVSFCQAENGVLRARICVRDEDMPGPDQLVHGVGVRCPVPLLLVAAAGGHQPNTKMFMDAAVFLETHEDEEKVEVEMDGKREMQRVVKNRLGLVVLTIELEERLASLRLMVPAPRVMTSPYRQPLTHFLNKWVDCAWVWRGLPCGDQEAWLVLHMVASPWC